MSRTHDHADQANATDDDMFAVPEELPVGAQSRLKSFIERVERLDEEAKSLREDRKSVIAELKGEGFDSKVFARIIILRRMDTAKRQEAEALLDLYIAAIGGL